MGTRCVDGPSRHERNPLAAPEHGLFRQRGVGAAHVLDLRGRDVRREDAAENEQATWCDRAASAGASSTSVVASMLARTSG